MVVVIAIAGCTPSPDRTAFTVEYYREHGDKRNAMLSTCANDPGHLGASPNCVNAREAARVEGVGSLQRLPPLGLPKVNPSAPSGGAVPRS